MYPSIIALVGHIRSGKSSIAEYLCHKYDYSLASNSDLLREIAKNLGMEQNRENLKKLGDSIFSVLGNDTLARFRLSQPQKFPIIVDGIRYKEEIELYSQLTSFKLIGVQASDDLRLARLNHLANQGKDSTLSKSDFDKLQYARSELQINELLGLADIIICNERTKSELYLEIDKLMKLWRDSTL
ncbi:AAA family ATPase [Acinetobacter sp. NS-4]|uniref:AAA family ATPase n=1 Tax=Acinetobacter sp. NS-4 TaxID=3127956 RepID=UPI00307F60C3